MRSCVAAFVLVTSAIILTAPTAQAQITNVTDDTSTPIAGSGHDYIHALSETVNPANGSLSIRINLPTAKSRGLTLPFSLAYDSNGVQHLIPAGPGDAGQTIWVSNTGYLSQGGWSFAVPMLSVVSFAETVGVAPSPTYTCNGWTNYVFSDATGGRHALNLGTILSLGSGACPGIVAAMGGDSQVQGSLPNSHPDSYDQLSTPAFPATVSTGDGTVYNFPSASHATILNTGGYNGNAGLASSIEDRNGNVVTSSDNGNGNFSFTDTAGRTAISSNGFGPAGATNTVTVSGLTYSVTWTSVSPSYTVSPVQIPVTGSVCTGPPAVNTPQTVISQILMPDGNSFKFFYGMNNPNDATILNPYGLLNEIEYPTGGWVKYKWVLSTSPNEVTIYPGKGSSQYQGVQDACQYQYSTPVIATREVSFDNSNTALTQSFQYSTNWTTARTTWATKSTTVNSTDGLTSKSAQVVYNYTPFTLTAQPLEPTNFPGQVPVENTVLYYDWGNTKTLRTTTKMWYDQYNLRSEQTTLENGTTSSQKVYCYVNSVTACVPSSTLSQVQNIKEYDFTGNVARQTTTTFQPFTNSLGKITDKPCKVVVQNGAGQTAAETDYLYDGGSILCGGLPLVPSVSAVANLSPSAHDGTVFGVGGTTQRGNATTITKICTWNSTSCTNALTTYSYDETGQVTKVVDPRGNTAATYSYLDSFTDSTPAYNTNAYVTSITDAGGFVKSFSYAYLDGQLTLATDENGVQTQYVYDSIQRPTGITYPNCAITTCGSTSISYSDVQPSFSVTKTIAVSSSQNVTSVTVMDGLGHTVQSQLITDPAGTDFTDTSYDGFGRVHTQSNAHRSAASSTDGTTTYFYDGIGRTCVVEPPDGTAPSSGSCPTTPPSNDIFTLYSFTTTTPIEPTTTVTDQAGKSREGATDALGRLTDVWEDPAGLKLHTVYTYDVLDNLLTVVQNGTQNRSFTYDSFSRLICGSNPEASSPQFTQPTPPCSTSATVYTAGTVGYSYDPDGNLISKEDARGVTTTYVYDKLNRLTQKSFNDGSTPTASFTYDIPVDDWPNTGLMKGRLTKTSTAGKYPTATYFAYDALGRVITEGQCVQINSCGTTSPILWLTSSVYDPLGNTTTYTDGNNVELSFTQSFDGAGRATQLTMINENTPLTTLVSTTPTTAYYPGGALHTLTFGNGLTQTTAYNIRVQPCEINLNSGGISLTGCNAPVITTGNIQDFSYNYNLGISDNGNVGGWTATGQENFSRSYVYDSLNRLKTYGDTGASQPCKGLSWTYDVFGNRTDQTVTSGSCGQFHASVNPTTNQLVDPVNGIYQYDAAGNLTYDGNHHYAYDGDGRLSSVDSGATAIYVYDASGRRVAKGAGTAISNYYVYGPDGQVRSERDGSNNWFQTYIYFGGQEIGLNRGTHTGYNFRDHLGSTRLVTLGNGCMFDVMDFLPFGEQIAGGDTTSHKFTGKERDGESNLDNFGARYNSSSLGRFMSPDPAGMFAVRLAFPQTLNRYSYVLNNPLSYDDPLGLDCAYLNDSGTGIESRDQQSSAGECGKTGGYWAEGTVTDVAVGGDAQTVTLTSTTNGTNYQQTSYDQDATLNVSWYAGSQFNPYGHIAIGVGNGPRWGLYPKNNFGFGLDVAVLSDWNCAVVDVSCEGSVDEALANITVPGRLVQEDPKTPLNRNYPISITGMQATIIQQQINQSTQNPPPYSVLGPKPACDCGTWAQGAMSAAGVQSGPPAPFPPQLIKQLVQIYGPR